MAKKRINWTAIQARYYDGEAPREIAKDYADCTARTISQRAYREQWKRQKKTIDEKILSDSQQETIEFHKAIRRKLLDELAAIAFADMADYVEVYEGGEIIVKTFDAMPEGASKAIKGIKEKRRIITDAEGEGDNMVLDSQLELTHHDKLKAIEMMGRWLGIDKPPADDGNEDGPKAITLRIINQRDV